MTIRRGLEEKGVKNSQLQMLPAILKSEKTGLELLINPKDGSFL
jgi:hypothetical protein